MDTTAVMIIAMMTALVWYILEMVPVMKPMAKVKGQQDDVPWETASGSLAAGKDQVGDNEDSIGHVVDSHISPHKGADRFHKGEDSDDGHGDEQLHGDDGVNLSDKSVSHFPVIPLSRPEAITHRSLLPIIAMAWAVVHGHRVDGGHGLWVASRVTVARLRVARVGRIPSRQDGWLPIAPRGGGPGYRGCGPHMVVGRWGWTWPLTG